MMDDPISEGDVVAERLGVSPETVGPLRTRCLRRLRAALEGAPGLRD